MFYLLCVIICKRLKLKLVELFFQLRKWSKNMWSCAATDTGHPQRSYLTVARISVAKWRSALPWPVRACIPYLCALRVSRCRVPYVPACLCFLRTFFFYIPYVPSFFTSFQFLMCLMCLHFFYKVWNNP